MLQAFYIITLPLVLLAIDYYILQGLHAAFRKRPFTRKRWFAIIYWFSSIFLITIMMLSIYGNLSVGARGAFLFLFFITLLFKIFYALFIIIDDIRRAIKRIIKRRQKRLEPTQPTSDDWFFEEIPRSDFLMKAGILAGAVPLYLLKHNMSKGIYDYQVKNVKLYLPNLPKAFDGLRVGQISDIHSGSFHSVHNMRGGVDLLMQQKADMIFFTGDLVNSRTEEVNRVVDVFKKVRAPLGVYSILGNHDYGDYGNWPTPAAKEKNMQDMYQAHKNLGWDLLIDEHRRIKIDGQELGVLGIGNWGELSRFPKYGKMEKAVAGTDDLPVKLLLSHDPSHWRAEVIPKYPQIDVMFSGHTHGMQFGVRTNDFQWSPIEYVYQEWAGLYREKHQQIYVNVGYGFLGYPGRIGILPEITIFELKAATDPNYKI
ncbi:metallophosphoesterase [Mucilaginibacter sp.]|uniref:metallophosphoesterase n=1 Tax=Mucilaginibacter sp. TaxID=1882438 RepID=UPI000CABF475|nr:metallophosphoesterase [Mucilaginibacter sp.]PLW90537.1 MAG: metallophosphatase [Mucilaginibacter sp.]PMP66260.1 MAG: metallophosphatase [Mucilaginibacter sp.]HEK22158.1 metallophosphoesterase [Bacteroidota bacterium]